MFTFNFTFHVPNPFSMSALTSVANAATDAFNSVATDIRDDPELLNYMVTGLGPGGVADGFGYDSNRVAKSPPPSFAASSSSASPRSKGLKGLQSRHTVGLGLTHPHAQNRKRHLPGHEQNPADSKGSTSGFVNFNSPPLGSGTPRFPTQAYSQYGSYSNFDVNSLDRPLPASRKRGWAPALSETTYASLNEDFTTEFFDTQKHRNVNNMGGVASSPGFGHDGYESSGTGSDLGDRRKWDEDEGENAMEAGESQNFLRSISLWNPLPVCLFISLSSVGVCAITRERSREIIRFRARIRPFITFLFGGVIHFYLSPITYVRGPSSPYPSLFSSLPPHPIFCMDK